MDYAKTILFNRQDLLRALLRRLSERLKPYEDALNLLFADLFRGRLPVDWRERWRTFVSQQAALGYVTEPWSVRDMERFIFEWARFCELLPVEEMRTAYAPADQSRAAMRQASNEKNTTQPQRDSRESEFDRQLAAAAGAVNEISTVLESLALKIDYAPINAPKEVHAEVDRIDALIRNYNEALERAREVWLTEGLLNAAYQRLLTLKGPLHLGLPAFTVDAQRQRAAEQQQRIFERLGQGRSTLLQTPPLSPEEAADCLVCTTLGGGVEIAAYQREGKWRVCKLLSLSSGKLTPDERRIFQMPAPTSYHGVKLAAVVVSFILARRKHNADQSVMRSDQPTPPLNASIPLVTTSRKRSRPLELVRVSDKRNPTSQQMDELRSYFEILFGKEGQNVLNAFEKSGGKIEFSNLWFGASSLNGRSVFGPPRIRIDSDLTPVAGAEELMNRLIEATGFTEVRQHLDLTGFDSIETLKESYRQSVKKAAATVSFAAELYLSGISIASEGADWVITIHDLSEGQYHAAIGFIPMLPASIGKTGVVLKHGRRQYRIPIGPGRKVKTLPIDELIELLESTRRLARNMELAGLPKPPGTAAHHIVPASLKKFPSGKNARDILKRFKISVDSAANGVYLPSKFDEAVKAAYHGDLHTERYFDEVYRRLRPLKSKESVLIELNRIRNDLLRGTFPR